MRGIDSILWTDFIVAWYEMIIHVLYDLPIAINFYCFRHRTGLDKKIVLIYFLWLQSHGIMIHECQKIH